MKHKLVKLIYLHNIGLIIVDWLQRMPAEGYLLRIAQYTKAGITVIIIVTFMLQSLAWEQAKGEAVLTGVRTSFCPLSPGHKFCLRARAFGDRDEANTMPDFRKKNVKRRLTPEEAERLMVDTREYCGTRGVCKYSVYILASMALIEGFDVVVMAHEKLDHVWVQEKRPGGYALDAYPEGRWIKAGEISGNLSDKDGIVILPKGSADAKRLYKGGIDPTLTRSVMAEARNPIKFYTSNLSILQGALQEHIFSTGRRRNDKPNKDVIKGYVRQVDRIDRKLVELQGGKPGRIRQEAQLNTLQSAQDSNI